VKPPRKKPVLHSTSTAHKPVAVVRRLWEENQDAAFGQLVALAVAEGVNPNTARGVLVRLKRAQSAQDGKQEESQ
jgi:hypothetical protein